jgi:hypothetical protein
MADPPDSSRGGCPDGPEMVSGHAFGPHQLENTLANMESVFYILRAGLMQ